ncbi:hypothetical protein NDU88_003745 [Pleurodeles waltl]|uniref:Uncharacterized protein n=1 Tax=Pleurodeles waltl TaxID=8319 RepID=A0AAV7T5Z2_PLEWA|nr:hypothetical protein NDU88_003745 [Pleurodeles waltl]
MPGNKPSNEHLGKPARQLLFSEALRQNRAPPSTPQEHMTHQPSDMADAPQAATMDCILQEISAVVRRLEGMDSRMISLTEETKSIRLDIAGFQSRVTTLEQRVRAVDTQATLTADRDQELLYLRSKVIDLEDRHCRDNVRFLGEIEGTDVQSFLRNILPQLTGLAFYLPLGVPKSTQTGLQISGGCQPPSTYHRLLLTTHTGTPTFTKSTSAGPFPHERPPDTNGGGLFQRDQ